MKPLQVLFHQFNGSFLSSAPRQIKIVGLAAFCLTLAVDERRPQPEDVVFVRNAVANENVVSITPSLGYRSSSWSVIFNDVAWIVDDSSGSVAAFDGKTRKPLWSNDGIVFRLPCRRVKRLEQVDDFQPLNKIARRTAASFSRVYFLLSKEDENFSTRPTLNILIALDSQAQGRLAWIRQVDEFKNLFSPTNDAASYEFSGLSQTAKNDVVEIEIQRGDSRRLVLLNAADGEILTTF